MTGAAFEAIVLAGGRAIRLGGESKAQLEVGGTTLLARALAAVASAQGVVVVGPESEWSERVLGTQEDPAFGGPVAAVGAGTAALDAEGGDGRASEAPPLTLVLACDMPYSAPAVASVVARAAFMSPEVLGAWGTDPAGRTQPLLAAYDAVKLRARLSELDGAGGLVGLSMRMITQSGEMIDVPVGVGSEDADTWQDVERMREVHG